MDRGILLYLACILSGFALIRVPLSGTLVELHPVLTLIGVISIIVFSFIIIIKGVLALVGK